MHITRWIVMTALGCATLGCSTSGTEVSQGSAAPPTSKPVLVGLVRAFDSGDIEKFETIVGMRASKSVDLAGLQFRTYVTTHLEKEGILQVEALVGNGTMPVMSVIFAQGTDNYEKALAKLGIDPSGAKVHTSTREKPQVFIGGIKADGVSLDDFVPPPSPQGEVKWAGKGPRAIFHPKGDRPGNASVDGLPRLRFAGRRAS